MGVSTCRKICGNKNEIEINNQYLNQEKQSKNNSIINGNLIINNNYNNFIKQFDEKLPNIGKYYDINQFKQIIPENANNYMIENVITIPEKYKTNNNIYEIKPIEFENGNIYSGNWNEKYKMDGLGQYYIQDGNILVEGIWDDGNLVYGRIFYSNDNIYEGEIKNSTYHGKGKLIFNNGEIYEGDFLNGDITGHGTFTFSDGTTYEGELVQGEFKGHGIMKWINGIQFEGDFSGTSLSSYGKLMGDNGEEYEGNFNNNYFNGKGKYTYSDGSTYEGDFEFGLKHGKGVYKKKDMFAYEGDWANDQSHGFGKFYYDDYIVKGVWRNGMNVEISNFEKGEPNNFNSNILNFNVDAFSLLPQQLPNLDNLDVSIKKFGIENSTSYLNTLNE
jgi:hypothetical protein